MHPLVRVGACACVKDNDNITSVGHHIGISILWKDKYGHTYEHVRVCGCARVKPSFIQKKLHTFVALPFLLLR